MRTPSDRAVTAGEVALRILVVLFSAQVLRGTYTVDVAHFWQQGQQLGPGALPYRGLFWEFPPLTVLALPVARVLDYQRFLFVFPLAMAACEYGALRLLRRAFPDGARALTWWWTAVALPLGTIAYFRFDFVPVLGSALALAALARGRSGTGGILVGVASKLYPGVLALQHVVDRNWRALARNAAACTALVAAWWAWSPSGMQAWLAFRGGSGLQVESVLASVIRPVTGEPVQLVSGAWAIGAGGWGWANAASSLLLVGLGGWLVVRAARRGGDVVALAGALVALVLVCSRLLSPQYLVWLTPFVALLAARGNRRPAALLALAGGVTVLYLRRYLDVLDGTAATEALVLVRNVLLVGVVVELVRACRPANVRSSGCDAPVGSPAWPTSSSSAEPVSTT